MSKFSSIFVWTRRAALGALLLAPAAMQPAQAASPAESFVSVNIDKGLQILNNRGIGAAQRSAQFQTFLEGLTDINRVSKFTLGAARHSASPSDIAAFDAAFKQYAEAVYQSRLSEYTGQTLKVTGSTEPNPGDTIVKTQMIDSSDSGQRPLEVDFRVANESGRLVVIDVAVAGVWLSIEERDQFSAFLGQHNGSIPALVQHLNQLTAQLKNGGTGK
jgi:phospholipid transport system substrate-binding protein